LLQFAQAPRAVATGRAVADDDVVNAIVMAWNDLSPRNSCSLL